MKKKLLLLLSVIAPALASHAQLPTYVPVNGLVAWYPFNGNGDDASGNALHGIVNGAVLTSDRYLTANSAYFFNNNYVTVASSSLFNPGTGLTVSAWVNLTSPNLDQKIIGRTNSSFNSGFILGVQNFQVYPEVWDNLGTHYTFNAGALSTGAWDHLVMTWTSGGYFAVYLNGFAVDSILASTNPIGANTEPLIIGVSPWSQSPTYLAAYGILDDMGIWNRALTATEIATLYQSIPQGINDPGSTNSGFVFPNPATDKVTVKIPKTFSNETFTLTDALGRVILSGYLLDETSSINLKNLPAGIYFLKMDSSELSYKIVKTGTD